MIPTLQVCPSIDCGDSGLDVRLKYAAYRHEGAAAKLADKKLSDCPYPPKSPGFSEERHWWLTGWLEKHYGTQE